MHGRKLSTISFKVYFLWLCNLRDSTCDIISFKIIPRGLTHNLMAVLPIHFPISYIQLFSKFQIGLYVTHFIKPIIKVNSKHMVRSFKVSCCCPLFHD